jgi:hypothetical protein
MNKSDCMCVQCQTTTNFQLAQNIREKLVSLQADIDSLEGFAVNSLYKTIWSLPDATSQYPRPHR